MRRRHSSTSTSQKHNSNKKHHRLLRQQQLQHPGINNSNNNISGTRIRGRRGTVVARNLHNSNNNQAVSIPDRLVVGECQQ
jgi:hypothetical protein